MNVYFDMAVEWSKVNLMNINYAKTKEMLLGAVDGEISELFIDGNTINRVYGYELLGVGYILNLT